MDEEALLDGFLIADWLFSPADAGCPLMQGHLESQQLSSSTCILLHEVPSTHNYYLLSLTAKDSAAVCSSNLQFQLTPCCSSSYHCSNSELNAVHVYNL